MYRINVHKTFRSQARLAAFSRAVICSVTLAGCATIETHSDPTREIGPYAGTGHAVHRVKQWWNNYSYDGQVVFAMMDVPLCLMADTLLLPYDLFHGKLDSDRVESAE